MAKSAKSKTATKKPSKKSTKKSAKKSANRASAHASDSSARRDKPSPAPHIRAYREHRQDEGSSSFRVVSQHRPIFGRLFEGRAHEFSGLGLVALGILLVLSVYLDSAKPVGQEIESVLSASFGVGRYFLPILSLGLGVALARRKIGITEFEHQSVGVYFQVWC